MSYTTFFYDNQIRRFLMQFIRIMSNFQVRLSNDGDGNPVYQRVPVFYGDASRQASQILRSNSENTIKSVPAMAVHINQLNYDRDRVQEPNFVSKMQLRTRYYDESTGQYTGDQAGSYTVERLMPVPYRLTLKVDVWTSSTEQKLMLLEQIMIMFNPAMEIQSTDNYIDWTSLSYVLLTDISWSNRSVPTGTEETIDIASLTFELPIWISAPAKVKQMGVVQKIVNSIYDINFDNGYTEQSYTFENYGVYYQGNTLVLYKREDISENNDGALQGSFNIKKIRSWSALINQYGAIRNGLSTIRLLQSTGSEVVGTIAIHPVDDNQLLFTPYTDTLPSNTLDPVTAIINPFKIDVDSNLLNPSMGTRYLLTEAIGSLSDDEWAPAWNKDGKPELVAQAGDIVEYTGTHWTVAFNSNFIKDTHYLTNLTTGIQYKWDGKQWSKSVEGRYDSGNWSITI